MLRKINLIPLTLAITLLLLLTGNAMAFCVFTVDGDKLICRTCSCAELKDAGVNVGNCVDVLSLAPKPTPYDKLLRYSNFFVTLHSPNGEEFQLASDATQKQFDEIYAQTNFKDLFQEFKSVPGVISGERVEQLARDLRVPVVPVQLTRLSRPSQPGLPMGRRIIVWGHTRQCYDYGFCRIVKCDPGPHCKKVADPFDDVPAGRTLEADLSLAQDRLIVELTGTPPDKPNHMTISENIVVDTSGLPYDSITILRGNYPLSYAENQFGTAILKVTTVPAGGQPKQPDEETDVPKFEVSPQFSFLSLNRPTPIVGHSDVGGIIGHQDSQGIIGHADNAGIGVRFTYNATRNVALEAVGNFIIGHTDQQGIIGHGDNGGFQMQVGPKIGKRFGKFGIFGKARPGIIRFSDVTRLIGTETIRSNAGLPATVVGVFSTESKTYFSTDVGGVVEYYPSRPIVIRFDLGDTIIRYGTRSGLNLSGTIIQLPAETKHNLQFSAGVGFRF